MTKSIRWSAWMKSQSSSLLKREMALHLKVLASVIRTTSMSAMAHAASFCLPSLLQVGDTPKPKSREQGLIGQKASNGFLMSNIPMLSRSFWCAIISTLTILHHYMRHFHQLKR